MARLPYRNQLDLAEEHRPLLQRPINVMRLLANSPGMASALFSIGMYMRSDSRLDPRLRELAIMQVSWTAHSPYEWSHHVKIGLELGVTEADVRAIAAESRGEVTGLDPLGRVVLRLAREMLLDEGASEECFTALSSWLDPERLVDLVATIAYYIATAKMLASFAIDVEDEYLVYLDRFPLPAR